MNLRMAKASSDEIERALALVRLLESTLDVRPFTAPSFPDTEDDQGEWVEGGRFDQNNPEDLRKLVEQIQELCPGLMRVVFGFQVMLDNCCDPTADHLAWKPEIAAAMVAAEKPSGA